MTRRAIDWQWPLVVDALRSRRGRSPGLRYDEWIRWHHAVLLPRPARS